MSLTNRMAALANRLSALPSRFGLPTYRKVTLVPFSGQNVDIVPVPKIEQAGLLLGKRRQNDWLTSTVQITGQELVVTIARVYDLEMLRSYDWLVTDEVGNEKTYTCEYIDTNGSISYQALLVPRSLL